LVITLLLKDVKGRFADYPAPSSRKTRGKKMIDLTIYKEPIRIVLLLVLIFIASWSLGRTYRIVRDMEKVNE